MRTVNALEVWALHPTNQDENPLYQTIKVELHLLRLFMSMALYETIEVD